MNNVLTTQDASPAYLFANVTDKVLSGTYDNVIAAAAAPVKRLFTANNDISTYSILETSDTAYLTTTQEVEEKPEHRYLHHHRLAQRYMDNQGKICANVVVDGNSMGYLSTFLGNSTFGNKDYTLDFIKNLTGTTDTRVGVSLSTRPRRTHF